MICLVFFTGTAILLTLDSICQETTGSGGILVFDIDKDSDFK